MTAPVRPKSSKERRRREARDLVQVAEQDARPAAPPHARPPRPAVELAKDQQPRHARQHEHDAEAADDVPAPEAAVKEADVQAAAASCPSRRRRPAGRVRRLVNGSSSTCCPRQRFSDDVERVGVAVRVGRARHARRAWHAADVGVGMLGPRTTAIASPPASSVSPRRRAKKCSTLGQVDGSLDLRLEHRRRARSGRSRRGTRRRAGPATSGPSNWPAHFSQRRGFNMTAICGCDGRSGRRRAGGRRVTSTRTARR